MTQYIDDLNDALNFGKYRDLTIEEIMNINAQYLLWAEEKEIISLSSDLQEIISICAEDQHSEWLREYCENEQNIEY